MVPGVAAADDLLRHAAARLHHAAPDCRERAREGVYDESMREAWTAKNRLLNWVSRSNLRYTCCRTRRRCASSSRLAALAA